MDDQKEKYSDRETLLRTEAALHAAFSKPPKPQSEMRLGKPRGKAGKSPGRRKKAKD
jgi:hypothetical protein